MVFLMGRSSRAEKVGGATTSIVYGLLLYYAVRYSNCEESMAKKPVATMDSGGNGAYEELCWTVRGQIELRL